MKAELGGCNGLGRQIVLVPLALLGVETAQNLGKEYLLPVSRGVEIMVATVCMVDLSPLLSRLGIATWCDE